MSNDSDSVIVPPQLFEEPDDWIAWVAALLAQRGTPMDKVPKANTVSGRLIVSRAPAWAQGLALSHAIGGEMDTPQAREVRERFEASEPLSLLPFGSMEEFRTFVPRLRSLGDGEYRVGAAPAGREFAAAGHATALGKARRWFLAARQREIERSRERAREVGKMAGPLTRDLLAALLQRDKRFVDRDGRVLVWENGAHGMYAVRGKGFCYGVEASPSVAGQFALLAMRSWRSKPPTLSDEEKVALLAPPGWTSSGSGFAWEGGCVAGDPSASGGTPTSGQAVIHAGGRAVGRLVIGRGRVTVKDGKRKILLDARVEGQPAEVILAWTASQVLKKRRRIVD